MKALVYGLAALDALLAAYLWMYALIGAAGYLRGWS